MKRIWKSLVVGLLLLVIGILGYIGYQKLTKSQSLPKPSSSTGKLAELHLTGGIGGFNDHLIVYVDGSASAVTSVDGKQNDFQVKPVVLDQLVEFSKQFKSFSYGSEDNPGGPDSLDTKIVFYGQGPEQPEQEQIDTVIRLLNSIPIRGEF